MVSVARWNFMRKIQVCVFLAILLYAALAPGQSAAGSGQSVAVDVWTADLASPDVRTRTTAAHELWNASMKDPASVKPAVAALSRAVLDTDLNIRYMAMVTLKSVGPYAKPAVPSLIKALDTFPGGTPPLDGPQRYYADARWAAAETLGAIGSDAKDAIPALQKSLKDPSEDVRAAAAAALKQIQGERAQ